VHAVNDRSSAFSVAAELARRLPINAAAVAPSPQFGLLGQHHDHASAQIEKRITNLRWPL
jgi:hypothetical protein